MKILITADTHDRWDHLEQAIAYGNQAGCSVMLFAGDLVAPGQGVPMLEKFNGPVHVVLGNNDGELVGLTRRIDKSGSVTLHYVSGESVMTETFDGLRFYMNHFPGFTRNAALSGQYDVCVHGHNHTYSEETLENGTLILNPGELKGLKPDLATVMIFDTETKSVEKIVIDQQE